MRKIILVSVLAAMSVLSTAQIPQGINYQAVAHTSTGALIQSTTLQVKAAILSDTLTPVIIWEELHSSVKTNTSGVFNIVIGTGEKQSGSASAFSSIDWSKTPLYLKIQVYYQNAWKYLGTSKLWSVPFALASGGNTDVTGVQNEINAIESGAGLNNDGSYSANTSSNYLSAATTLKNADDLLDSKVKTNEGNISANSTDITNLKTNVNAVEAGAGLNDNGSYSANTLANYISAATSLKNADDLLDSKVKSLEGTVTASTTGISNLQTELNAAETGVGLNNDGTYSANSSANYIAAATSLKDADNKLDAQVKSNSDKIAANAAKMKIKGTETSNDSALFRVVNRNGQTVFAVYNEGVRIYVDNGAKGAKGGFAVGGFGSDKAPSQNLLFIDSDSIRAYIDTNPAKGAKGGFAVGGFGGTKAATQNLLVVNADSIRAYIDTETTKGAKGGFAVGGFSSAKTVSQDLLVVSADSIRAYIDTNTGKGAKGGFAVGGFGAGKASGEEYLRVTRDSTRIYLNDTGTKGAKGGFAVGGFGSAKETPNGFMYIDPDSTRFYVRELAPGTSSTFNIIGINLDQTQTSLLSANTDTVGIAGVLNVQNNMTVTGDINYTGTVNLIVPELLTLEAFNLTETSVMVSCDITSNGSAAVIASGVVWSISPKPTVDLPTKTTDGTSLGQFTSVITTLTAGTTYYIRAYATNANGTGYGNELTIVTPSPGSSVADYDGNLYNMVTIGTQVWMAENLKTTRLNDGTLIPNITDNLVWSNLSTAGYAWYNNDNVTYADYGLLYNWTTVNTGLLCPTGWHVASEADWTTLTTLLGGSFGAGSKLKEIGTTHWLPPNSDATNEVGFTALPGGLRGYMGPFNGIGDSGNFWTSTRISTDPTSASIYSISGELMLMMTMEKSGLSVRCVQD